MDTFQDTKGIELANWKIPTNFAIFQKSFPTGITHITTNGVFITRVMLANAAK